MTTLEVVMSSKVDQIKWGLFSYKNKKLLTYGLKNGYIDLYDEELIVKLRDINHAGLPASVILLSDFMCNGYCYERALLLAKAFLDTDDDVTLVYADIDSLRLNPENKCRNSRYAEHCFVERITPDGKKFIYDTSNGFVYDKNLYWKMENPRVKRVKDKRSISRFLEYIDYTYGDSDKGLAPVLIPFIESHYKDGNEMYAMEGIELLQREVELFKKKINYDGLINGKDEELKVFAK